VEVKKKSTWWSDAVSRWLPRGYNPGRGHIRVQKGGNFLSVSGKKKGEGCLERKKMREA